METLDQRLRTVIDQLANSARMSKLISINAALITEQIRLGSSSHDTAALRVVASEIQRLSEESSSGLAALHLILGDVQQLTHTINLAGRQRMLSQKVMKLHLLQRSAHATPARAAELVGLIEDFERTLDALQHSALNTPAISVQLTRAADAWRNFHHALAQPDVLACSELNERLLEELHAAVQRYEELAGTQSAPAASSPAVTRPPPALASSARIALPAPPAHTNRARIAETVFRSTAAVAVAF